MKDTEWIEINPPPYHLKFFVESNTLRIVLKNQVVNTSIGLKLLLIFISFVIIEILVLHRIEAEFPGTSDERLLIIGLFLFLAILIFYSLLFRYVQRTSQNIDREQKISPSLYEASFVFNPEENLDGDYQIIRLGFYVCYQDSDFMYLDKELDRTGIDRQTLISLIDMETPKKLIPVVLTHHKYVLPLIPVHYYDYSTYVQNNFMNKIDILYNEILFPKYPFLKENDVYYLVDDGYIIFHFSF